MPTSSWRVPKPVPDVIRNSWHRYGSLRFYILLPPLPTMLTEQGSIPHPSNSFKKDTFFFSLTIHEKLIYGQAPSFCHCQPEKGWNWVEQRYVGTENQGQIHFSSKLPSCQKPIIGPSCSIRSSPISSSVRSPSFNALETSKSSSTVLSYIFQSSRAVFW